MKDKQRARYGIRKDINECIDDHVYQCERKRKRKHITQDISGKFQ